MALRSTRRRFFGSAAAVAGLAAAPRVAGAAIEPEPWGIKLGVCTYSVREFDRARAIEMIRALRTPWVSIKDVHLKQDQPAAEIEAGAREFRDAGLRIMSGGNVSMPESDLAGLRKHFEYARAAGMPMMVCAPRHENLHLIEQLVKEYNIRAALHNHGPEDKNFPTPQSVLEAVRTLDPRVGLCMDVGHTARTGVDVVESMVQAGPRLLDMHIKDLADFKSKDSQVDCGAGRMPFPRIFQQLKRMNYQGCVNLEYEINGRDPLPGIERSFAYLRGVLAGLAAA